MRRFFDFCKSGLRIGAVCIALPTVGIATPCASQETPLPADSILVLLAAPSWQARYEGLTGLSAHSSIPAAVGSRLLTLARAEAIAVTRLDPGAEPDSEGYGEYVMELVLALFRLGEPSAASDIARMGGLQVATKIQLFVAAQGGAVLSVLDSLYRHSIPDAASVLETWAMMLARSPGQLTLNERLAVQQRLLGGVTHESEAVRLTFLDAARRAPFPEFWPLVDHLATTDPYRDATGRAFVQDQAGVVSSSLDPMWKALPASTIIAFAGDVLLESCSSASGAAKGHCVAATAQWESVKRHLSAANRQPLLAALDSYRQSIRSAVAAGSISNTAAILLVAYANRVEQMS